jgi:hypothetical protein
MLAVIGILLSGSVVLFLRERALWSFLQLVGAGSLMAAVLCRLCESLRLLAWMRWGAADGVDHYLDLGSARIGLTTFPLGYLGHVLSVQWGAAGNHRASAGR